ncbi:BrnA antitoxin family protein [Comamonas nitrativorans]|uniref:BrnA antitoxin family protein n=1 Tax=Comamonas nitrativorans TaxID=108437 RepID=A0ABV9GVI4_9BURK
MTGLKTTSLTSEQMREARKQGQSASDWGRVRQTLVNNQQAQEQTQAIAAAIERKRGRPVQGEPKTAISLRVPNSVLAAFKSTGPGWQTRMADALQEWLRTHQTT